MPYRKNISAIILAGGRSSRMGTDKGLILFNGRPLVTYVLNVLQSLEFREIFIITQNAAYKKFGYPCFPDLVQDKGPLGGICAGLSHATLNKSLILGCDMPFISEQMIMELVNTSGPEDVLLTHHHGMPEPLCSIYDQRCLEHFSSRIELGQLKITDALTDLNIRNISFDEQPWFKGNELSNMNSPDDLNKQKQ